MKKQNLKKEVQTDYNLTIICKYSEYLVNKLIKVFHLKDDLEEINCPDNVKNDNYYNPIQLEINYEMRNFAVHIKTKIYNGMNVYSKNKKIFDVIGSNNIITYFPYNGRSLNSYIDLD